MIAAEPATRVPQPYVQNASAALNVRNCEGALDGAKLQPVDQATVPSQSGRALDAGRARVRRRRRSESPRRDARPVFL